MEEIIKLKREELLFSIMFLHLSLKDCKLYLLSIS